MFIGGLSWQTSPDSLRDYFSKFGEIRECMVMRDPTTKRSRGFGFVTFADPASVDKVLGQPHHELDSKTIDPKVAFPRRAQPKMVTRTKKIFVGGLSANTVVEDVKQYFEQFGKWLVPSSASAPAWGLTWKEVLDRLLFWAWRVGGSPQCVSSLDVPALSASTLEGTSGKCSLQQTLEE
uniref:Musashi RNA binding protein 2 n=1 Tax=Rousettus aegyptiacus TaxID=9407 RepID=A0A7J8GC49_ROUAE|nr:musashi RNA binding protein 2 [Rousettus aegyptiacus]